MTKTIIIIAIFAIVALTILRRRNKIKAIQFLGKQNSESKANLNAFTVSLANKPIDNSDITKLTNLIHSHLSYSWLYNCGLNTSLKGAKLMLDSTVYEQAKMITDLKEYFQSVLHNQIISEEKLVEIKDRGVEKAFEEMNEIFDKL